jgi:hypothetical protein
MNLDMANSPVDVSGSIRSAPGVTDDAEEGFGNLTLDFFSSAVIQFENGLILVPAMSIRCRNKFACKHHGAGWRTSRRTTFGFEADGKRRTFDQVRFVSGKRGTHHNVRVVDDAQGFLRTETILH